jgi:hypothetical protein
VWTDSRAGSTNSSVRPLRGSIFTSTLDQLAAVELGLVPTCLSTGAGDHPQGIAIATDDRREQEQSMACGGGVCLVAWRRGTPTGTRSVILASRLAPDGTVLDPAGFEVGPPNLHGGTAVAFTGQSFVVAWRQGQGEIRGAEVGLDGTLIESSCLAGRAPSFRIDHPATTHPRGPGGRRALERRAPGDAIELGDAVTVGEALAAPTRERVASPKAAAETRKRRDVVMRLVWAHAMAARLARADRSPRDGAARLASPKRAR